MANIVIDNEGWDCTLDVDLYTSLKTKCFEVLERNPNGLDAIVDDVDLETFRRMATTGLPSLSLPADVRAILENVYGDPLPGGIYGMVNVAIIGYLGQDPAVRVTRVLVFIIGVLAATDVDGEVTPLSEGKWTTNEVEDLCFKIAKDLQLSLSGEEEGY